MNDSTHFIIENIEKTYSIYRSISGMEEIVLSQLDAAIKENYSDWMSEEWIVFPDYNLKDDYELYICKKDWTYINDNEKNDALIWAYLQLSGSDPIWRLFGLPAIEPNDKVSLYIELSNNFDNKEEAISQFDTLYQDYLETNGFVKMGGYKNRYYEIEIVLNNNAILEGIKNDNWEEAISPLMETWAKLCPMDWKQFNKYLTLPS